MPSEAEVPTLAEVEARVKKWRCDGSYSFGRKPANLANARRLAIRSLREGLLLAVRNGFPLSELLREMDEQR